MSTAAEYLASNALEEAFAMAIGHLENKIKSCGELAGKDSRLSDEAKAYFASQAKAAHDAIVTVRRIHKEFDEQRWAILKAAMP